MRHLPSPRTTILPSETPVRTSNARAVSVEFEFVSLGVGLVACLVLAHLTLALAFASHLHLALSSTRSSLDRVLTARTRPLNSTFAVCLAQQAIYCLLQQPQGSTPVHTVSESLIQSFGLTVIPQICLCLDQTHPFGMMRALLPSAYG